MIIPIVRMSCEGKKPPFVPSLLLETLDLAVPQKAMNYVTAVQFNKPDQIKYKSLCELKLIQSKVTGYFWFQWSNLK